MHHLRRILFILVTLFSFSVYAQVSEDKANKEIIPFKIANKIPFVEVMINGKGPYLFIVDTGTGPVVVSESLQKELSLQTDTSSEIIQSHSTGHTKELESLTIDSLRLGKVNFHAVKALLYRDLKAFNEVFGVTIYGILGFSLFKEYLLTIAYPKNQIILQKSSLPPVNNSTILSYNDLGNNPYVVLPLGGINVYFKIDSGKSGALMVPKKIAPSLNFSYGPIEGALVKSLSGDSRLPMGRIREDLRFGQFVIKTPIISVVENINPQHVIGIIGGKILSHFTITFDQLNKRVFFEKDGSSEITIPSYETTGINYAIISGQWVVKDIIPKSSAREFDIKVGDRLNEWNGFSMTGINLFQWEEIKDKVKKASEVTHLTFARGVESLEGNISQEKIFTLDVPESVLIP